MKGARWRRWLAGCACLGALAAGCAEGRPGARGAGGPPGASAVGRAAQDSSPGTARRARVGLAVQLGAFADSVRAAKMRDSLLAAGWDAVIHDAGAAAARWRVRIAHSPGGELPRFVARAFRGMGRETRVVEATLADGSRGVELIRVNRGSHGMRASVRWTRAPDGAAILVIEDPVAIEADPVPNGFVAATERGGAVIQRDSVWDVAPSPDWTRVAYGRGCSVSGRGEDTLPTAAWRALAACAGLDAGVVRNAAFGTSGMAAASGIARPVIVSLDSAGGAEAPLPRAGGWRVRWTPDGTRLALGDPPSRTADDAPPERWMLVDPRTGADRGPVEPSALAQPRWTEGPPLELGGPIDSTTARTVTVAAAEVTSRGGWVRVRRTTARGTARSRIVGPGIALAATRTGRFIVALAPAPELDPYSPAWVLVVYDVGG